MSVYKLVIFDLDDCLIHEGFDEPIICDDTIEILKYLKNMDVKISLASHNYQGLEILKRIGLYEYFDPQLCCAFFDDTKKKHLASIISTSGIPHEDIIFFDDLDCNIIYGRSIGIQSIRVDYRKGITLEQIKKYIN